MNSEDIKYYVFGITLTLFQFAGYSVMTLPLLALSTVLLFSTETFLNNIKTIHPFMLFLGISILIGMLNLIFRDTSAKSLMMWGQFYFFAIMLLGVKDKNKLTTVIKWFVYLIFIADILSNILLALGYSLPWAWFPPVRPGELLPRFPGVKNNALYSGSISFLALCFIFHEKTRRKWPKYIIAFFMMINLLLAGSFRYYVILAAILILYYLKIYRSKRQLLWLYGGFIIGVIILTFTTVDISKSNELRWKLWLHTLDLIGHNPLTGIGFFFPDLREHMIFTYHNLAVIGVTESTILLFALCFGIPVMCVILVMIYKTLLRFCQYTQYEQELGLFLGLSLDLFWGGSLDNCMSLSLFLLSLYLINYTGYMKTKSLQYGAAAPDHQV